MNRQELEFGDQLVQYQFETIREKIEGRNAVVQDFNDWKNWVSKTCQFGLYLVV